MRLSTHSMMYANGLKGVLSQETDMNRLVEQIGSGRKFLTPADDPLAAALSINVAQTQSMNATLPAQPQHGQDQPRVRRTTFWIRSPRRWSRCAPAWCRPATAPCPTATARPCPPRSRALARRCSGWPIVQTATVSTCSRVIRAVRRPTYRTRPARSCTAAPRANAPSRLTNRARCPPATWARISSAGRTPARRVTSAARPHPAIPARPSSARRPSRRVAPT